MKFDAEREARSLRAALLRPGSVVGHIRDCLSGVPVAVLAADDNGRYIWANLRASELTGYSQEELLLRSVTDLTPPDVIPSQERLWSAFEETHHQRGTFTLLRKDGSRASVEYEAFWDLVPGVHVSFLTPSQP